MVPIDPAGELLLNNFNAADLPPAAQKRFARFVLQTMRQDAAEPEKEVVTA